MLNAGLCAFAMNRIALDGILGLIVKVLVVTIVYNLVYLVVTCKSKSFKDVKSRIEHMLKGKGIIK